MSDGGLLPNDPFGPGALLPGASGSASPCFSETLRGGGGGVARSPAVAACEPAEDALPRPGFWLRKDDGGVWLIEMLLGEIVYELPIAAARGAHADIGALLAIHDKPDMFDAADPDLFQGNARNG